MDQDKPSSLLLFHPYYPIKLQGQTPADTTTLSHILGHAIKNVREYPCLRGFLSLFSTASPGQIKQQYCMLHTASLAVYNKLSETSQTCHTSIPISKQDCDIAYDDAKELITVTTTAVETAADNSDKK